MRICFGCGTWEVTTATLVPRHRQVDPAPKLRRRLAAPARDEVGQALWKWTAVGPGKARRSRGGESQRKVVVGPIQMGELMRKIPARRILAGAKPGVDAACLSAQQGA